MKSLFSRKLMGAAVLVLLLVLSVSADALAQGRGRGHGRGFDEGLGRKCGKFVNCHDARDGRWDGRGPRRTTTWSSRYYRRTRRDHDRRWDNNHRNWRRYHTRFRR
jgi:hypothetical protein